MEGPGHVLLTYRGRTVTTADVAFLRDLMAAHPTASRRALSTLVCQAWHWVQPNGAPRDMVCRGLMLALDRAGHLVLPVRRTVPRNPLATLCLRAPAWLQRAGLGADVMGTGASTGGARAEGVHVAYAPNAKGGRGMNLRVVACALLVTLVVSVPGWAVTVTGTGGCTTSEAVTSTIDFTGSTATDSAGHATYAGTLFNRGINPCGSDWLYQSSIIETTTITFDAPIDYFGLAWGTKDNYNSLKLFDGSVQIGPTYTGVTVPDDTYKYINFFADSGEVFTRVVLSSEPCCFETDNHSYRLAPTTAVPEPSTVSGLAMALLLGTFWFARNRRFARRSVR